MEQKDCLTSVSNKDVFEFLWKYGRNTHSFLLAYNGRDWFRCDAPRGLGVQVEGDSRPSDALALAVRAEAPICVEQL